MSAAQRSAESQRRYEQGATKAQLIKALMDSDTDDVVQLSDFLELFMYSYLSGPFGEKYEGVPEGAEWGVLWTIWRLVDDPDEAWQCREALNAMQQFTPPATG